MQHFRVYWNNLKYSNIVTKNHNSLLKVLILHDRSCKKEQKKFCFSPRTSRHAEISQNVHHRTSYVAPHYNSLNFATYFSIHNFTAYLIASEKWLLWSQKYEFHLEIWQTCILAIVNKQPYKFSRYDLLLKSQYQLLKYGQILQIQQNAKYSAFSDFFLKFWPTLNFCPDCKF